MTFYITIYNKIKNNEITAKEHMAKLLKSIRYDHYNLSDEELKILNRFIYDNYPDKEKENKFDVNDNFWKNAVINEKLKKEVLESIPDSYTKLQQAYFIYRKLCEMFTYDEHFLSNNQAFDKEIYKNFSTLNEIDLNNRQVICSSATIIYIKILEELGIKCRVVNSNHNPTDNYREHLLCEIKIDNYLISADIAINLIKSDMVNQKKINKVFNFNLMNDNPRTLDDYKKEIEKVDLYFESLEEQKETLHIFTQVRKKYGNKIVSFEDRKEELFNIILSVDLAPVDKAGFILDIKRLIFSGDYDNKCDIYFLAAGDVTRRLVYIISFKNASKTEYYLYDNNEIKEYSIEELIQMASDGKLIQINTLYKKCYIQQSLFGKIEVIKRR